MLIGVDGGWGAEFTITCDNKNPTIPTVPTALTAPQHQPDPFL